MIYAASALAILQFSLDAHVDALGFPFLIFGLLFYQKKKLLLSLLPLGISLQFKPVALVILPILFLLPLFSDNQTTRLWCFGFLVIALSVLYLSKKPLQEKFVLAVLLSFLISPVVHVWYVGWLIVLLPIAPISSGLALAATASLPSITYVMYQLQGAWKDYPLVMALEYVPVIVLLWFDLRKQRIGSSSLAGGGNFISDGH